VREYVGGYDDWLRQVTPIPPAEPKPKAATKVKREKPRGRRKISFKEQREVEALPEQIERLESEQQNLYARLADPTFYKEGGAGVVQAKARLETIERELPQLYARWQELEDIMQQKGAAVV
jgi:ATP-binding cassette subfamily F protein uup